MGKIEVNITKKQYVYIDPGTGQEISPEEFSKKYPGLDLGGPGVGNGRE